MFGFGQLIDILKKNPKKSEVKIKFKLLEWLGV